jgi:curli biogenesis system outer membrane secretion channel CsgG
MTRRVIALAVVTAVSAAAQAPKKRVAVFNFEYGTVSSSVAAIFGTNHDVGKGIADLLVDRLVKDGVYSVIERKAIEKVLAEQNFSNTDRADANTAARLGKILGVDAIIIGSITQFGRDDRSLGVGGTAVGGIAGRYGLGRVGTKNAKAVVGITARLVSTETAEILATATGKGESKRSGVSLLGGGGSSGGAGAGAMDMSSQNFASTILGEAVSEAVGGLASQLNSQASLLPTRTLSISGLVADVSGNTLILNVGSAAGVKVGDRLKVTRPVREVRDPATGKVIRRIEEPLGEVVITEVDATSSVGTFTGAQRPKTGDAVRN